MAGFAHRKENQRIFYQGKIFRDYGRTSGSRKEILQIGAENLGGSGSSAILRLLEEISDLFSALSLSSPLTIVLGNVNLFRSIVESLGLSPLEQRQLSFLLYRKNLPEIRSFLGKKTEPGFYRFWSLSASVSLGKARIRFLYSRILIFRRNPSKYWRKPARFFPR